jgi:N-acetylmuramoyl-L-alanine amidase
MDNNLLKLRVDPWRCVFLPVSFTIRPFFLARSQVLRGSRLVWTLAACAAAGHLACAQQAPPAPHSRFVVVLDAAHGGGDPGGRLNNGRLEKSFTLALSARLRSLLAARGIAVVATRDADADVEPDKRAEIANHAQAQACLSLHASESGFGVHLFVSSLAPALHPSDKDPSLGTSAQSARIPAWKTAQAAWVTRSLALAGTLNSALLHSGMSVTLGRTALPVLDSMSCPAVAVEIAPERGAGQQATADLDDPDYQARVAAALAAALVEWRAEAHQP